jgi:hypothetical protein
VGPSWNFPKRDCSSEERIKIGGERGGDVERVPSFPFNRGTIVRPCSSARMEVLFAGLLERSDKTEKIERQP